MNVDSNIIVKSICEKLHGVNVAYKLKFSEHLDCISEKKTDRKVNALSRLWPYMNFEKRRILINSFFNSQCNNYPLVWIFHSRAITNKINHLHERYMRIVYSDKSISIGKRLETDKSVPIRITKSSDP